MPKATRKDRDAVRFGAIIARLRQERGWTLARLADRTGLNPTYVGVMEKGGNLPSITTIFLLADVFGVSAGDIVREVEEARRAERRAKAANSAP